MEQSLVIDENDRKSLECPICKDLLTKPKVTRCGHVFCESCLTDYLERNECNCPPCPVCRERIVLPRRGMQGFRTEHFYQGVAERLKKHDELVKNMNTGICGLCKETSELISKCLTCACVICKQCMPSHNVLKPHCTVVLLSEVDNLDVDELMSQRKIVCESHDTELANLYCHDCNKVICLICKVTEPGHLDHKCEHINERGEFCRKYLEDLQEKIAKLIEDATAASRNVTTIFSDFLRDIQEVTKKVNNTVDKLIAELNRKREEFLKSIEEDKNEFFARLRRQKNKIEKVKTEAQALMDLTKKAFTYGTDADIANLPNDLNQQMEKLTRDLNSSLHKDFRIRVDFHEGEYQSLIRLVFSYNIGTMEYSQQVVVKACEVTNVHRIDEPFPSAAMVCNDFLFLQYKTASKGHTSKHLQNKYIIVHRDMLVETTIHFDKKSHSKKFPGTRLLIKKDGSTATREYTPFCVKKDKEEVIVRDQNIKRLVHNRLVETIHCSDVEGETGDVDINDQEILLVGKLSDGRGHCTIFNKEDRVRRLRYTFPASHLKQSSNPPCGSFNHMGNVVFTVESNGNRELMVLNTTTKKLEKLIVPSFPSEDTLQLATVYEKCEGLLYTTTMYGRKILTISYLP